MYIFVRDVIVYHIVIQLYGKLCTCTPISIFTYSIFPIWKPHARTICKLPHDLPSKQEKQTKDPKTFC